MISAVVVSLNEGKKLDGCLKSVVGLADEIIVIDLESSDDTRDIAKKYKALVIHHKKVPYVEQIRNWSIDQTKGEWVLILDPDERVSSSLKVKLINFVNSQQAKGYAAINIPFKNIFFGHWIKHTNFWPDKHLRFFRKGRVTWQDKVHSYPLVDGEILEFPEKPDYVIEHFGYDNRRQFIEKQLRYSESEAKTRLAAGERFSIIQLFWKPLREFLARYIKHQGFLDGWDGIFLVGVLMWYQVLVQLKMLSK